MKPSLFDRMMAKHEEKLQRKLDRKYIREIDVYDHNLYVLSELDLASQIYGFAAERSLVMLYLAEHARNANILEIANKYSDGFTKEQIDDLIRIGRDRGQNLSQDTINYMKQFPAKTDLPKPQPLESKAKKIHLFFTK